MTELVLTLSDFRAAFTAFVNPNVYPDTVIEMFFGNACEYVSPENYGTLRDSSRQLALYQMTAHLLRLNDMVNENEGAAATMVQGAKVDQVSVTLTPPPVKSQFAWWLNLTPYGQSLWALLQQKAVGGMYIGGSGELAAFRRVGGAYKPSWRR